MTPPSGPTPTAVHGLFDVAGRHALVTGAGRGIGRALAAGLLEAGCTVVVNGRDADAVARTCGELREMAGGPGRGAAAPFDVTDAAAVRAAGDRESVV